jgi:putative ABC transport system ATP-binding protein
LLHDAVDSYGQTLVMVTHEARAAAIADRILFLADGLIVRELRQVGEAEIIETIREMTVS